MSRYWSFGVAMAVVAIVFAMAGCGGGGGGGTGDSTPPQIVSVNYPTSTTTAGASLVTIQALVQDNVATGSAQVLLTKPDSTQVVLTMTSTDTSATSKWYSVAFTSDANTTQVAQIYTFVAHATDASGNAASSASKTITVPALVTPPPPPF